MSAEEFDTIVIGSGAGGMAAAICLAKAGQKVLVLEQHYVAGGWCHSFKLGGERFSPGVHYIGLLDDGQSTSNLYKALGITNDLVLFRMNPKGFEHCWIGDKKIDLPAGIDNLYQSLAKQFPEEKKNIREYLDLIVRINYQIQLVPKMNGFIDHLAIPFKTKDMGKYALFSLKRVIDWHIKDPLLKSILNIQCGDHGLPPSEASFPIHCVLMNHYFEGAFYPMGGGAALVKAMTISLKKNGGMLRTKQLVKKILVNNNTAIGVEMEDGTTIFSKNILSNADPSSTYINLVGKEYLSASLLKKLSKTTYSVTSLILFLTVDMDVRKAGFDSGNIWRLKNEDMDGVYRELKENSILEGAEFPALFISCSTLKDPTSFNGRYHNFEIVTFIDYKNFSKLSESPDYNSDTYLKHKEIIIQKIMNTMEVLLPGVKDHVIQRELGTPNTNKYYIKSTDGSIYGTEKKLAQMGPFGFKSKTEIKNLYLCGASTLSHGVGGAGHSGVAASAQILDVKPESLMQFDENQKMQIYEAEDSSNWPAFITTKIESKRKRFLESKK